MAACRRLAACWRALYPDMSCPARSSAPALPRPPHRPSRPALPPDPELGSRRQSKVKYIYRLLRERDVGESLEGKTVRVAAAAPPAVTAAPLLRPTCPWHLAPVICALGSVARGSSTQPDSQPQLCDGAARAAVAAAALLHCTSDVRVGPACSACRVSAGCQPGPCPCCAALQLPVQVFVLWPDDGTWYKGHVEECDVAAKKASKAAQQREAPCRRRSMPSRAVLLSLLAW